MHSNVYRLLAIAVLVLATCLAVVQPVVAAPLADGGVVVATMTGRVSTSAGYVNVRSGPGTNYSVVGRLTNGETVTILGSVSGQAVYRGNSTWYDLGNKRYVYSGLVRIESSPPGGSPPSTGGQKWIEVILSQQRLIAHEGDRIIMNTLVSTGKSGTPTPVGTYYIYSKLRSTTMAGPGYYLPNVPYTMYFYRGYAIHGTYWHNNFGHPMSHGCVNMRTSDAAVIYGWAPIGTKVVVRR